MYQSEPTAKEINLDGRVLQTETTHRLKKALACVDKHTNSPHPSAPVQEMCLADIISQCQDDFEPILSYLSTIPAVQRKPSSILIAAIDLHRSYSLPFFVISHEPVFDITAMASEKLVDEIRSKAPTEFQSDFYPATVKTITLSVRVEESHQHFLITQLGGAAIISDAELTRISEAIGHSRSRLKKRSTLNHQDFDPATQVGRQKGMVGPFPDYLTGVTGLIYLRDETHSVVALRYTPSDTVFMARELFEALVQAYAECVQMPFHVVAADTD